MNKAQNTSVPQDEEVIETIKYIVIDAVSSVFSKMTPEEIQTMIRSPFVEAQETMKK